MNHNFIMGFFFSLVFLPSLVRASKIENLFVFDNFESDDYDLPYGAEEDMVDYAVLAVDRKRDLPQSFTICSSVHLNFMTASIVFYQLYQDDGQPWFNFYIRAQRDLNRFQDQMRFRYYQS